MTQENRNEMYIANPSNTLGIKRDSATIQVSEMGDAVVINGSVEKINGGKLPFSYQIKKHLDEEDEVVIELDRLEKPVYRVGGRLRLTCRIKSGKVDGVFPVFQRRGEDRPIVFESLTNVSSPDTYLYIPITEEFVSGEYVVAVIGRNRNNEKPVGQSNTQSFRIEGNVPPGNATIELTSPQQGGKYKIGESIGIAWKISGIREQQLDTIISYSLGSDVFIPIQNITAGLQGSINWSIPYCKYFYLKIAVNGLTLDKDKFGPFQIGNEGKGGRGGSGGASASVGDIRTGDVVVNVNVGRDGKPTKEEGKKSKSESKPARFDFMINGKASEITGAEQPEGLNLKWKDKGSFVIKNGGGGTLSWKAAPTLYKSEGKQIITLSQYSGNLSGGKSQLIEVNVDKLLLNKKIEKEGQIFPTYIIVTAARGGFGGFFKKAIGRVRVIVTL